MADKERLEECKNILNYTYDINGVPHHRITTENLKWLIQQAERAEELEKKVERYRETLEFYADEETYEMKFTATDEISIPLTVIELDEGKKARQALEEGMTISYDSLTNRHVSITKEILEEYQEENERLKQQNRRYRQAIEWALYESAWCDEGNALAAKVVNILTKALEEQE